MDNDLFDAEIDKAIDEKLDSLVLVLKKQIPMASTFLVGSINEKLKSHAKGEMLKLIPEVKQRLLARIKGDLQGASLIEMLSERMGSVLFRKLLFSLSAPVAIIAAVCGLFQVALMYFFGYIL